MEQMRLMLPRRLLTILAASLAAALLLAGCDGDGGKSGSNTGIPDSEIRSGVFLDSPVAGLYYETATLSGVTDAAGRFRYRKAETVRFSIGAVAIGGAPGADIITPLDLAPMAAGVADPRVTRVCRLLQALDEDGDPRNGIVIPEAARTAAKEWPIDLDAPDADFEASAGAMLTALSTAGVFPPNADLPSAESARNHMRRTLDMAVYPIDAAGKPHRFLSAGLGSYAGDVDSGAEKDDVFQPPEPAPGDDLARQIEEADIIRADGSRLYLLNAYRGLIICDIADLDRPAISGRLALSGEPKEMYIRDNRAYALVQLYDAPIPVDAGSETLPMPRLSSRLYVVNIADPARPELAGTFDLPGQATDSRIVGHILYAVLSDTDAPYQPLPEPGLKPEPEPTSQSEPALEPASEPGSEPASEPGSEPASEPGSEPASSDETDADETDTAAGPQITVAAFDLSDPSNVREVDREVFDGSARFIHVTESAVFVAAAVYDTSAGEATRVTHVDISDPDGAIVRRGAVTVPGHIADEFKMSYFHGHLRICTHQWIDGGVSYLYVIDVSDPDHPMQVGKVELGRGEQLFATRFDGNRAYLVTYERKDPLWVVDLSDPAHPAVRGELIVPGWSTHIEPLGDRLVALGVDDTAGWRVAVSLFDVSNPEAPALVQRLSFGESEGWSHSSAYNDVKAFSVLPDIGLILLPYTTSAYADGSYGEAHRLQLIDLAPDKLTARGWVDHKGSVLRGRVHEDRLFSVSSDELRVIDASDRDQPVVTATVALSANVLDFVALDNGHGVQMVAEPDGSVRLRSVALGDADSLSGIGEIELGKGYPAGLFVNGAYVYAAVNDHGDVWIDDTAGAADAAMPPWGEPSLTLFTCDFTDPGNPARRGAVTVPGTAARSLPISGGPALCPWYGGGDLIQVKPDALALTASYSYYYGQLPDAPKTEDAPGPAHGNSIWPLTVLDLSDPDAPVVAATAELASPEATAFFARDSVLYYSYPATPETNAEGRQTVRYHLGRTDLFNPSAPSALAPVNIPGVCVGMEGFGPYIFTLDQQWDDGGNVLSTFNSLKLEDDTAYLLDGVEMADASPITVVADGLAWITAGYNWRSAGEMKLIDLFDPRDLRVYTRSLPQGWAQAIGARGDRAFFNFQYGTACYNAADPNNIRLEEMRHHQSWNTRVHFTETHAYAPLGYHGLWVKAMD